MKYINDYNDHFSDIVGNTNIRILKILCSIIYLQKEVMNMNYTIQFNEDEEKLFKSYAKFHGCSLAEALKGALLEKIEDEYDTALAEQAHLEYLQDPQTISHKEFMKKLGL